MISTVIGWAGAVVVLAAYGLLTSGRIGSDGVAYLGLNALGAVGLAVSAAASHAVPSTAVNVIWLVIGIGPLARAMRRRAATRQQTVVRTRQDSAVCGSTMVMVSSSN